MTTIELSSGPLKLAEITVRMDRTIAHVELAAAMRFQQSDDWGYATGMERADWLIVEACVPDEKARGLLTAEDVLAITDAYREKKRPSDPAA